MSQVTHRRSVTYEAALADWPGPDVGRLLAAFALSHADRIPLFELGVFSPSLEAVLGRTPEGGLVGAHTPAERVAYERARQAPDEPRLVAEYPQPLSTLTISPRDYVELCAKAGMDAVLVQVSWTGLHSAIASRGEVRDWSDVEAMVAPPDMAYVRAYVQRYLDATAGTNVGVGVAVHSCLAKTYEALGFENFALLLYDDPALVRHLMDAFAEYGTAVAETVADMPISFFWVLDDLADSHGLLVHPDVLEALWVGRTARILAPVQRRGLPVVYHCDGRLDGVLPLALRLGFSAIQPVQATCNDIFQMKRDAGDRICLMGNIDIGGVLAFGSEDEVDTDVRRHMGGLADGGGYVLGSSHSITSAVPPQNYLAMIAAGLAWGTYADPRHARPSR
jgi:uroporphyrinogen-III decarboxylase